jgi:hypothetical protein
MVVRAVTILFGARWCASWLTSPFHLTTPQRFLLLHPEGEDAFVHSENVRQLQIGTVSNGRRGASELRDCTLEVLNSCFGRAATIPCRHLPPQLL